MPLPSGFVNRQLWTLPRSSKGRLVNGSQKEAIIRRFSAVRLELRAPNTSSARTTDELQASLGVASHPEHARLGGDLVKRADEALYRAKREGRNRVVLSASASASEPFDTIS